MPGPAAFVPPKPEGIGFPALSVFEGPGPGVSAPVSHPHGFRWTDYIPLGCRMPGTRFIAFKVPLKKVREQRGAGAVWAG